MAVTSTVDNAMPMIILSLVLSALSIISVIPSLAVTVRRLHDTGKSGAWYFISFIPIIGEIWILVLMCLEGDRNSNYYGAPTKNYYNIYR